jgi:hypothetical protein
VVALAVSGEPRLHVALLEGVDNVLSLWLGKPGQWENVLRHPTPGNPVVCLWIPPGFAAGEPWVASQGRTVWRFGARTVDSAAELGAVADASQREDIVTLTGVQHSAGCTLFACTGQHLYRSPDAKTWDAVHDFGEEPAIAFSPSSAFNADRAVYALLLGGAFCRGAIRD